LAGEKAAANNSLSFAIMSAASASKRSLGGIGSAKKKNKKGEIKNQAQY